MVGVDRITVEQPQRVALLDQTLQQGLSATQKLAEPAPGSSSEVSKFWFKTWAEHVSP